MFWEMIEASAFSGAMNNLTHWRNVKSISRAIIYVKKSIVYISLEETRW